MIYEFDECVLDTATQQLSRGGELVHIEPQVLAVLELLVSNSDRVVTKIELLDEVWGDRFVSETALTSRMKLARKACGDSGREQRIVKTVHSRGYRLVADVVTRSAPAEPRQAVVDQRSASIPVGHRSSSGVVGRNGELDELDEVLGDVEGGNRNAVFVSGGIGSGKSTLIAEFLERHDQLDGWFVSRGQCIQTRGGVEPYFCLFDALSHLARTDPDEVRDTLERVAPSWLAQMPSLIDDDMAQRLERRLLGSTTPRMLREGAEAFEELARRRPLILVLDDLQWTDDCTLDVIDLLLQRRDPAPLLLIGTVRAEPAAVHSVIATAVAGGQAIELQLGGIDQEAVRALAQDRFGGATVPDELIRIVTERSDGVPLFAEEIVTAWIRGGQVAVVDSEVVVLGSLEEIEATLPTTLPALLDRELLELEPEELAVLEACAVSGEMFDGESVAAGLDRALADVEATLASLAGHRGLIAIEGASSWPDGTVSASYAFAHRLYRQVIYDRIPVGRKAVLHGRIGARLEEGYRDQAGELAVILAEHFIQAGDNVRAVENLRRAGEQAALRSAHAHASDFLLNALERIESLAHGKERDQAELRIRMGLGPTLVALRGWFDPTVSVNYERALELCEDESCPEAAAARYGLATVSELHGEFARTEALLSPVLEAETDDDLAMAAHELVACSTFHQGAFDRSLQNASMVLESWDEDAYSVLMARIAEHPASSCNSWSSLASWCLGRSDESLRQAELAVSLGERNLYALSTAVQQRAMFHQIRGEADLCLEWAERTREVGQEQSFSMRVIQADIYRGWALGVSGRTEEGIGLVADGLGRFRAEGATLNEAYYLGLYADARLHGGQPAEALELLDEAIERMRAGTRTYFFESELHRLRARALLDLDDVGAAASARDALTESQTVAETQGSPALVMRTVADRLALELKHGDAEPWRDTLADLLTIYDGQDLVPDVVRARELLAD